MRVALVGPGLLPIPPVAWGAVESATWDLAGVLRQLGHIVAIFNDTDPTRIAAYVHEFNADFVHLNHDSLISAYPLIRRPCAITPHSGYLCHPERDQAYCLVMEQFAAIGPNIMCLTPCIREYLASAWSHKPSKLFLCPNGVSVSAFRFTAQPQFPDRSICLARIEPRKRQSSLQYMDHLYFAGPLADPRFTPGSHYLGEWTKLQVHSELTNYCNLVLLSDGEAHPLVVMEAFAAGLGVVVSEAACGNLDVGCPFVTVVPEEHVANLHYVAQAIALNRSVCRPQRQSIREYAKRFDWLSVAETWYLPSVRRIVECHRS